MGYPSENFSSAAAPPPTALPASAATAAAGLKLPMGGVHGGGARGLGPEGSWFRMCTEGTDWFWGEFPVALLLELAVVERDVDCCCWFFCGGDLGLKLSMSGVVTTRWGASSGGFRPPPPCQTFPSLSAKFLQYA